jgi:hypothetical protein
MMAKIFISHRRNDTAGEASRSASALAGSVGKCEIFPDADGIRLGLDLRQSLHGNVTTTNCMLALIGPDWFNEDSSTGKLRLENPDALVRKEIADALGRKIPVTLVFLQDAKTTEQRQLPDDLQELACRETFDLRHRRLDDDVREIAGRPELVSRSPLATVGKTIIGKPRTLVEVGAAFVFLAALLSLSMVVHTNQKALSDAQERYASAQAVYASTQDDYARAKEVDALRAEVDALRAEVSKPQIAKPIEGKVIEGKLDRFDDDGWPKVRTEQGPITLALYGVTQVNKEIENRWMDGHPGNLSCREVSVDGTGSRYRCLAANTFDLSEALLLNGGAKVLDDAPEPYRKAQQQAKDAKRGTWRSQIGINHLGG